MVKNNSLKQEMVDITEVKKQQLKTEELKGSRLALINILEDAEEARREADKEKNKTLAILANFTDGLLVLDKENIISLINPRAEEFLNVKNKEIIGRLISELDQFPNFKPLINFLKNGVKKVFREELSIKENLILEVSIISMTKNRERSGTLIVLHDITREKNIERMKTEFVSISAHQLRTPLSAIKWTLKMLLDGDIGKITEEQRVFIERTYKSNERMIRLINDLLDISRIEEGRYLYQHTLCQIEDVIQSVIDSYQEEIDKRKLKVEFKKPEGKLPQAMLDVEKIILAIQNLFDNAVKYTLPHGIVTISLKDVKNKIEFSIKDTGVGIPENQKKRIFSKFFRAVKTTRMETDGSGLGLFIAKNIIEAHNGKIWFESTEGKGTTFYFSLPIKG